uniref:Uncharacterized protein n=1 Tax=Romanomermis culicivorax TaxID=13658 RepID=A0A915HJC7_ROMCU
METIKLEKSTSGLNEGQDFLACCMAALCAASSEDFFCMTWKKTEIIQCICRYFLQDKNDKKISHGPSASNKLDLAVDALFQMVKSSISQFGIFFNAISVHFRHVIFVKILAPPGPAQANRINKPKLKKNFELLAILMKNGRHPDPTSHPNVGAPIHRNSTPIDVEQQLNVMYDLTDTQHAIDKKLKDAQKNLIMYMHLGTEAIRQFHYSPAMGQIRIMPHNKFYNAIIPMLE